MKQYKKYFDLLTIYFIFYDNVVLVLLNDGYEYLQHYAKFRFKQTKVHKVLCYDLYFI